MDQLEKEKEDHIQTTTNTTTPTAAAAGSSDPFQFKYLASHPTSWDPHSLQIPLNIRLNGCIVPSSEALEGARISFSHVVVLDGLVDDVIRKEIQKILLGSDDTLDPKSVNKDGIRHLPAERWERKTADMAGAAPTWGLRPQVLESLLGGGGSSLSKQQQQHGQGEVHIPDAILEVQSRLVKLYPEYRIAYLPSEAIQNHQEKIIDQQKSDQEEEEEGEEDVAKEDVLEKEQAARGSYKRIKLNTTEEIRDIAAKNTSKPAIVEAKTKLEQQQTVNDGSIDCSAILANAAAEGDTFRYHVDADPTSFPPSRWTRSFGEYFNGEPGKPLLVTLLIYIDDEWERDWGGETLFLDGTTDTGIFVRPRPGRAILMEQDVVHRVNPPSSLAGGRLRLSLVWKLAFIPKVESKNVNGGGGGQVVLARKEWGQSTSFGSAARVDAVKRQLLAEKKRK